MNHFEEIKNIISLFEENKESSKKTLENIYEVTGKNIDIYTLENYWRSENLDDFVKRLIIPSINDWENINDNRAIILIKEILENLGNNAILDVNADALEKRYSKPTGTVIDYIYYQNILEATEMLKLLKKNTVISL